MSWKDFRSVRKEPSVSTEHRLVTDGYRHGHKQTPLTTISLIESRQVRIVGRGKVHFLQKKHPPFHFLPTGLRVRDCKLTKHTASAIWQKIFIAGGTKMRRNETKMSISCLRTLTINTRPCSGDQSCLPWCFHVMRNRVLSSLSHRKPGMSPRFRCPSSQGRRRFGLLSAIVIVSRNTSYLYPNVRTCDWTCVNTNSQNDLQIILQQTILLEIESAPLWEDVHC